MNRSAVPTCTATDDRAGHSAIFERAEDVVEHSTGTAHIDVHFGVVDGCRIHSLGKRVISGCPLCMHCPTHLFDCCSACVCYFCMRSWFNDALPSYPEVTPKLLTHPLICHILLHARDIIPGVRFARALRLMQVPDILQYLQLLRTARQIRFAQLVSNFLSVCLTGAGVIHLVSPHFRCFPGCSSNAL